MSYEIIRNCILATFECPNGIFKLDIFKLDCLVIVFAVWALVSGRTNYFDMNFYCSLGIINLVQCSTRNSPREPERIPLTADDSELLFFLVYFIL